MVLAPRLAELAAVLIFLITYVAVAIGRMPGVGLDRAGSAFLGACLMVAAGVLPLSKAILSIDFNTVALLLGMMILVANLRLAGFFGLVTEFAVRRAHHPVALLVAVVLVSGLLSAFLVNDTVCLVLSPLVLDLVLRLEREPVPYMLAVAMASNIGSAATITGNPQNIIIGSLSGIPYGAFAAALAPAAGIGLGLTVLLILLVWRREFFTRARLIAPPARRVRPNRPTIIKALVVSALLIAAFFAGVAPAKAALIAGAVLLATRRIRSEKIYAEIDWTLLLMFAGLFVVVAGLDAAVLGPRASGLVRGLHLGAPVVLAGVTAALSNLVSNVPAVLVLKPFVAGLADPRRAWLIVAMAATFAGNFTLLGSVANLIVAKRAAARGVTIGFRDYFIVGAPLTLLTLLVGLWTL